MEYQLPTDSELEVLQVLWTQGPSTVRVVNDHICLTREVGYTNTLKIMQIMMDKGLITRQITDRVHIYSAAVDEEGTQNGLLKEFVDQAFRGSPSSLVMRMLGSGDASQEEISAIKDLIAHYENKKS